MKYSILPRYVVQRIWAGKTNGWNALVDGSALMGNFVNIWIPLWKHVVVYAECIFDVEHLGYVSVKVSIASIDERMKRNVEH